MNLPDQPPTFRQPEPVDLPWLWRLEDTGGEIVDLAGSDASELAHARFVNQSDAESWIGEMWHELADAGVRQVTLLEADREVYGPMSLSE